MNNLKKFLLSILSIAIFCTNSMPIFAHAEQNENILDEQTSSQFRLISLSVGENKKTVVGEIVSDKDIIVMLVKPGCDMNISEKNLRSSVSDLDMFKSINGVVTFKFYEDDLNENYHIYARYENSYIWQSIKGYDIGTTIYVAPNGNDNNEGTKDSPVKTMERARKEAILRNKLQTTIEFAPGEYDWETVYFTDADVPAVYEGNGASFRGTTVIDASEFKPLTDNGLKSVMHPDAAANVLCLDLTKLDINIEDFNYADDIKNLKTPSMFLDGKALTLARYPNSGYMKIDEIIQPGGNIVGAAQNTDIGGVFKQNDSNLAKWITAKDAYAAGHLSSTYSSEFRKIDNIRSDNMTISLACATDYGMSSAGMRWYITNLIEEIDIPGEWYVDKDTKMLYFYPPEDFVTDSVFEISTAETPLISMNGAKNITMKNFNIFGGKSDGIYAENVDNVVFSGLDIEACGGYGVRAGGNNILIKENKLHNLGSSAISITKGGNRMTLTPSGNMICNNHIYNTAMNENSNWHGGIAIEGNNVGTKIYNNLIHSIIGTPYTFKGNENDFSYNEVWSSHKTRSDGGATYGGGDLSNYGNKFTYNYVHGCYCEDDTNYNTHGIIAGDDWLSGTIIENNIVYGGNKEKTAGFGTHSRDNIIRNNIAVCLETGVEVADRYRNVKDVREKENFYGYTLRISEGLDEGYATTPIWLEKYPTISTIMDSINANDGRFMVEKNIVTDNISVDVKNRRTDDDFGWLSSILNPGNSVSDELEGLDNTIKRNTVFHENKKDEGYAIFVDPDNHDFRLKSSAVQKYGFSSNIINENNFDMSDIGIQTNITRPETAFKIEYPYNNQFVSKVNTELSWSRADYADRYLVEVAEDIDFSKVVFEKSTIFTNTKAENLIDGKKYYWRVTAINESKQIGNEWLNTDGINSFTVNIPDVEAYSWMATEGIDKSVTITGTVKNNDSYKLENVDIITAFYNDDGSLYSLNMIPLSINSGDIYEYNVNYPNLFDKKVRVFIWNKSMVPLVHTITPFNK